MNKLPTLAEEAERISAERGYYIPPWKLNEMMKVAGKVMGVLVGATFQTTYEDIDYIMAIVKATMEIGAGNQCP